MTEREIDQMSRVLGGLESAVKTLTETWQRQDDQATEGRRILHGKVEAMAALVANLAARVEAMAAEMAIMKPSVRSWEILQHRSDGARWMLKTLWTASGALIGAAGYALAQWLHLGSPKP